MSEYAVTDILRTKDRSHTLYSPKFDATYHSTFGALLESRHVCIDLALAARLSTGLGTDRPVSVFEMGFGTGLNAFLSLLEARQRKIQIRYTALELYPIPTDQVAILNYPEMLDAPRQLYERLHNTPWEEWHTLEPFFSIRKLCGDFLNWNIDETFDVVYYDAFEPLAQPGLWDAGACRKIHDLMATGAFMSTYCSKGSVRRSLEAAGLKVTKYPGPPGKREVIQCIRT